MAYRFSRWDRLNRFFQRPIRHLLDTLSNNFCRFKTFQQANLRLPKNIASLIGKSRPIAPGHRRHKDHRAGHQSEFPKPEPSGRSHNSSDRVFLRQNSRRSSVEDEGQNHREPLWSTTPTLGPVHPWFLECSFCDHWRYPGAHPPTLAFA